MACKIDIEQFDEMATISRAKNIEFEDDECIEQHILIQGEAVENFKGKCTGNINCNEFDQIEKSVEFINII